MHSMRKPFIPLCVSMFLTLTAFRVAPAQAPGEIINYAGNGTDGFSGDGGPATSAQLYNPYGIALDKSGNLYIADLSTDCIRKVTASTGIITAVVGQCPSSIGFSGDGGLAINAQLNSPTNIAFSSAGDMYIADTQNQRVRKVEAATGIITTVAGNGFDQYSGDGGPATSASLDYPEFIAVDPSGNLYIADSLAHVVRKVTVSTGIITTVVGNGTSAYTGDGGPAIDAALSSPYGIAFDSAGNLYIVDQYGVLIRKVTASTGIISTVVGNGVAGYSGDGGPAKKARMTYAQGLTVDRFGNLYIADMLNYRIRKVTAATQVITTVAGNGIEGPAGTGGPAVAAQLGLPYGIAVDGKDNFYICETVGSQVRKVFAGGPAQSAVSLTAPGFNLLVGQIFALTAKVTGPLNSPMPTGTVKFYYGTTEVDSVPLNSSGLATYTLSLPAVASYEYSATYSGDKNYAPSVSTTLLLNAVTKTAAPPYFGPAAGTYTHNLQVSIYDSTPQMSIFYTTDGTTPSSTNGTQYAGAIPVTANTTIKAVAVNLNYPQQYADSRVAASSYVINLPYEAPLPRGEWAWESGGAFANEVFGGCRYQPGTLAIYGTLGVSAPGNEPGSRAPSAHWIDKNGNFWLFGGEVPTGNDNCADTNDLWMFNPVTKEWTWMSGSNTYPNGFKPGVYGTLGKFAPGNVPGSRDSAVAWTDRTGNLWLFGGRGFDSIGALAELNDLWEFDMATRQWAWMSGSKLAKQSGSYGTLYLAHSGNTPGSRSGAVGWTNLKGDFWLFGGSAYDSAGQSGDINDLWEFNPSSREWTWMGGSHLINQHGAYGTHNVPSHANIPGARDNAMAWVDAHGKFWLFGGNGLGATNAGGVLNDLWEFNPSSLDWTWASGSAYRGTYNAGPPGQGGVYDKLGIPDPGNTPGSRFGAATWTDAHGNLWMSGGIGYDSVGNYDYLDDLWEFDRSKWLWAWMGGHSVVPGLRGTTIYGKYRVPSSQTQLGPRSGAASWTDKNGNLWLFGGLRRGDTPTIYLLNDLFEYQVP